jgi:hypothetical protein
VTSRHDLPSPNGWAKAEFPLAKSEAAKLKSNLKLAGETSHRERDGRHWPSQLPFRPEKSPRDDHHDLPMVANQRVSYRESLFRFDRIETGLWILDLTRFLDVNRFPPRIKSGAGFRLKTL